MISSLLPLNSTIHGTSMPPFGISQEYHLSPVTLHLIEDSGLPKNVYVERW